MYSPGLEFTALVLPVAGQQVVVGGESHPAVDWTRGGRSRGVSQRRCHQQPERQNQGKRRVSGLYTSKKIKGRKRHILNDTDGNLFHSVIHAADIQDR